MPNYNRTILAGHMTRDPETRGNPPVCNFGLAVNRKWKSAAGIDKEEVLFIDCAAFGKTGEAIARHLTKGRAVLLEGRLRMETWEDRNTGAKRSKIGLIVDSFVFLSGPQDSAGDPPEQYRGTRQTAAAAADPTPPYGPDPVFNEEDIPF